MKYLLLFIAITSGLQGFSADHRELAQSLEHGVQLTAAGRISDGVDQIYAQGAGERLPKDKAEYIQKFKSTLEEVRGLGPPRRVSRISLRFFGEDYYRLRVLDRRAGGAVLWTFFCEKDGEKWVMISATLSANTEFAEVAKDLDASDFSKDEPKG